MDHTEVILAGADGPATMPEELLRDASISFGAKGLYAFLATLPETEPVSVNYLVERSPAQHGAVRTLYRELQETGWLVVERVRGGKGQFQQHWALQAKPRDAWEDEAEAS